MQDLNCGAVRQMHLTDQEGQEEAMSFGLYSLGYVILIIGVGYMAHLMHIPQTWIGAIVIVLVGLGIVTAVQNTRQRDPR
jgi:hypothetical protein